MTKRGAAPPPTTRLLARVLILVPLLLTPPLCPAQETKEMVRPRRVSAPGEEVAPGEVLSRYVLAFYPDEGKRRDGWAHRLRVEGPAGLTVSQSRRWYVGRSPR